MKIVKLMPLTAFALLAACSKNSTPTAADTPAVPSVATINGVAIDQNTFDYYVKSAAGKPSSELSAEQRSQYLDNLVRGEVVAQQAEKDGLGKSGDTAALLVLSRLQIMQQAEAESYLKDKKPSDTDLKAEYDKQVAAMPRTQYHARHILVPTQEQAQKIIDQLKKGAKFEDLAKADSTDSSKSQGGDLGWFSPASMVKPFADAVQALKKNEYTQTPVQSQFGWHVIQLLDTRDTPVPPFDQVKDRLSQIVQQEKFKDYTNTLMSQAKIEKSNAPAASAAPAAAPAAPTSTPAP